MRLNGIGRTYAQEMYNITESERDRMEKTCLKIFPGAVEGDTFAHIA